MAPQKGADMMVLRIDAGKAERIITQILRDEKGMPLQVFAGGLRRRRRRVRRWISIGLFRKSRQTAKFSRVPWQKSSLKGRVSFGTRANFGSSFTINGAIFGRTRRDRVRRHCPSSTTASSRGRIAACRITSLVRSCPKQIAILLAIRQIVTIFRTSPRAPAVIGD
jgi:hypothetical protein